MTENDILRQVKDTIREELKREANETIDKLCHKLKCELGKHKNEMVAEMLSRIDIVMQNNDVNKEIIFQINIRSDNNAKSIN